MIFPAPNGNSVELNNVYYCEKASGTLISQASLILAGCRISFSSRDMDIFSNDNILMFTAKFNNRSWTLPRPFPRHVLEIVIDKSQLVDSCSSEMKLKYYPPYKAEKVKLDIEEEECLRYWHRIFGH